MNFNCEHFSNLNACFNREVIHHILAVAENLPDNVGKNLSVVSIDGKIFDDEMLIIVIPTNLLQIFLNFQILVKVNKGPVENM